MSVKKKIKLKKIKHHWCVKVTPEESIILQKKLFKKGITWAVDRKKLQHIGYDHLLV